MSFLLISFHLLVLYLFQLHFVTTISSFDPIRCNLMSSQFISSHCHFSCHFIHLNPSPLHSPNDEVVLQYFVTVLLTSGGSVQQFRSSSVVILIPAQGLQLTITFVIDLFFFVVSIKCQKQVRIAHNRVQSCAFCPTDWNF